MNQNPAYVSYEPGSTESNLLFTMAGPWAELKYDPESIYYHDIGEKDQADINAGLWDRIWKEGADMAVVVRSHYYFVSSVERFLDVPEIWAQIAALANVLMNVDRLDGPEVTHFLEMWNHEQRRTANATMQAYRANCEHADENKQMCTP